MEISRREFGGLGAGALVTGLGLPAIGAPRLARIKVGVLKFGTVSWELDTIKHHGLDQNNGLEVTVLYFAGEDATNVAMLAGDLDVIVSDWLWVSRQRSEGEALTLAPYSTAVGAIMVKQGSDLIQLPDLAGKKIGIAGGPLDKSWLLIQGLARQDHKLDLAQQAEIVYGAPPLLAEKALSGELDAVLNFWHFCARMEAQGFRRLIGADDAARGLGASGPVCALGYVFREKWADENRDLALRFVQTSAEAKSMLASSDPEWQRLAPLVRAEGRALEVLRDRYRQGIPRRPIAEEERDAAALYEVLAVLGGEKLVGKAKHMAAGTYWAALKA
ncbi:MAG: ABC transporter substrate-binding protein [Pseudomonadota bacterium]|nr:ABC transporter substrate-binding protein [Pseudomonadota bacterium]